MVKNDIRRKYWNWSEQPVTDESIFHNRRQFIKKAMAAAGGTALFGGGPLLAQENEDLKYHIPFTLANQGLFPAKKNEKYSSVPKAGR